MKVTTLLGAPFLIGGALAGGLESDALTAKGLLNLKEHIAQNGFPSPDTCTWKNVAHRREWSRLKRSEKLNYIDAVKCLAQKPALTPSSIAAGAKSRYDDFVVTHIQLSLVIHGNGNFLSWHRYYLWTFEQTLRNECGYRGYLPYFHWAWWAEDPKKSPLLDGSDNSISGDGEYVAGRNATCVPNPARCFVILQPGAGGGCISSGPFKDWVLNLGPLQSLDPNAPPNPSPDGLGYNPRCLSRDISIEASLVSEDKNLAELISNSSTIAAFQDNLQNPTPAHLPIHLGGHYTIGGDAGTDFYNSPSDPYFWFHHAMIDRVWWTWQNQDIEKRRFVVAGTLTFLNTPPTRNATLDDVMTMGEWLGVPNITIANASSTLAGPFCYIYE